MEKASEHEALRRASHVGTHSEGLVLEGSRTLSLFTLFILYVGQGMPIGLFFFAVPAWMAANGASAAEVGSVAALTALP